MWVGNLINILVGTELWSRIDYTHRGIVVILPESICTRKGKDEYWIIGHGTIRLYGIWVIHIKQPISGSEPSAKNLQIDGDSLKGFQPSEYGNMIRGTGNDSWYGKIEIYIRKYNGKSAAKHLKGVQLID